MSGAAGAGPLADAGAAAEAWLAACLLRLDPGLGGLLVIGGPGRGKSAILAAAAALWPPEQVVAVPAGARAGDAARLPGGVLLVESLHLLEPETQAVLAAAVDRGEAVVLAGLDPAADAVAGVLAERCAFWISLPAAAPAAERAAVLRHHLAPGGPAHVAVPTSAHPAGLAEADSRALSAAAAALGIASLRADLLAGRAARASAALAGRDRVAEVDLQAALHLVLAPRAGAGPAGPGDRSRGDSGAVPQDLAGEAGVPAGGPTEGDEGAARPGSGSPGAARTGAAQAGTAQRGGSAAGRTGPGGVQPGPGEAGAILPAAAVALPDLVNALLDGAARVTGPQRGLAPGRSLRRRGARQVRGPAAPHGVPRRSVAGRPGLWRAAPAATVRAALPWQRLRGRGPGERVQIRAADLRVRQCRPPGRELLLLVVDGSASMAQGSMRRAKGALEAVLGQAYRRRAHVALAACAGGGARWLVPPGRSVERARRAVAALPAGGGTPLAAGLALALEQCLQARRRGFDRVGLVLVTDGRANRPFRQPPAGAGAGPGGAPWVRQELVESARRLAAAGAASLVLDPRPAHLAGREAAELAAWLGGACAAIPTPPAASRAAPVRRSGR